jgi:putative heme iron utilization protein
MGLAEAAIAHMNADHPDAMVLYCRAFSKATDTPSATMTGIDRYGFDMAGQQQCLSKDCSVVDSHGITT